MSKLKAIELENFMSIREARLEFDGTGIINLAGYNDSGKSAITRALEVLFYDAYSNDQINFIQDGQPHFGVGLEFDDGIAINKYKYATGQSVWEMLKNDEVVFTNRLKDGIAALSTIPDAISEYLGVVQDEFTGEELNVRRNTDKLFLINTSGGDNYKIINSLLRADILAEAVKRMNEDRNKLQTEVTSKGTVSMTLKGELEELSVLSEDVMASLKQSIENVRLTRQRTDYLMSIDEQNREIGRLQVYEELPVIDTRQLRDLTELQHLKVNAEVPIYTETPIIDTERLNLLSAVLENRQSLDVILPEECNVVDINRIREIRSVGEAFNALWNLDNQLTSVEEEYTQVHNQLHKLSQEYGYKVCQNCGSIVS